MSSPVEKHLGFVRQTVAGTYTIYTVPPGKRAIIKSLRMYTSGAVVANAIAVISGSNFHIFCGTTSADIAFEALGISGIGATSVAANIPHAGNVNIGLPAAGDSITVSIANNTTLEAILTGIEETV